MFLLEPLIELESEGNAMRYLDSKGRIAWKATPDLRDYLNDLKLDAEADFAARERVTMLNRPSANIPFSIDALKASLSRLENEFENYQDTRDRDGIYQYLAAVLELVVWWKHEHKAKEYARRALCLQRRQPVPKIAEPFAAIIFCTADPEKVDFERAANGHDFCRYATLFKDLDEPLR